MIDTTNLQTKLKTYSTEKEFGFTDSYVFGKFENATVEDSIIRSDIEGYVIEGWKLELDIHDRNLSFEFHKT